MRQEVVAQLNHLSTLVAIQTSRQQSVKPFYQILNVWQRQQDFSFVLILACHRSLHVYYWRRSLLFSLEALVQIQIIVYI